MKIVVDSNIIFSALISGKEIYLDIFKMNDIYTPDIVFPELNKYESHLIKKTKLKQSGFRMFVQMLFEKIKDTPFVALSLELGIPLWTNDKALCGGAKKMGFDNFVTTEKLLQGI